MPKLKKISPERQCSLLMERGQALEEQLSQYMTDVRALAKQAKGKVAKEIKERVEALEGTCDSLGLVTNMLDDLQD